MSDLSPTELRRMNWYAQAAVKGINYTVGDSVDTLLIEKNFIKITSWGKITLTSSGIAAYRKLSPAAMYIN